MTLSKFQCPECDLIVEALASEAWHECPKRLIQADPGKGKKKLPVVVSFEKSQVSDQDHNVRTKSPITAVEKERRRRTKGSVKTVQKYTINDQGFLVVTK